MKTLREYIDQLDEIDRRGFLKGMGAAAVAGATGGLSTGAKADWEQEPDITDPMSDEVIKKWKNVSNDGSATLKFIHSPASHPDFSRQLALYKNGGGWVQPKGSPGHEFGRIRIDNNPPIYVRFGWMENERRQVLSNPLSISAGSEAPYGAGYQALINSLLTAKQRILLDTSGIGGRILEFSPNIRESAHQDVAEEELEEASPDAVKRIEQLVRYK